MSIVNVDISISLDGFLAGPNPSLKNPLGENGTLLHEWAFATRAWREPHGLEGGDTGVDNEVAAAAMGGSGATIMGRRMFSGGAGPWESDPNADAWWGDDPPFHHPVFVLTHHAREPLQKQGGTTFTFVTDGIESALDQARSAAGDKDIRIGGGGDVVQQCLAAGLVDRLDMHIVPVLLGSGTRLFSDQLRDLVTLETARVVESPTGVVHASYGVTR